VKLEILFNQTDLSLSISYSSIDETSRRKSCAKSLAPQLLVVETIFTEEKRKKKRAKDSGEAILYTALPCDDII
jgi:hypothetical protein